MKIGLTSYSMMQPTDEKLGRLCNDWVMTLMPDHKGRVWIGTSAGVCALDAATGSFRPYGWDTVVDAKACYSLCETRQGDILIGTEQVQKRPVKGDEKDAGQAQASSMAARSRCNSRLNSSTVGRCR